MLNPVKYTDACVESFLGGDMKALFMNTQKIIKRSFE
jgi:mevalonate kinase